jgi:isopentenyl diphosphate isomerase/L-lactate dehydrogenase-like FMN-dependent dehydrogenase
MKLLLNVDDWRRTAASRLPRIVWDYLEGGAEDGVTLAANRACWSEIELMPRTLVNVAQRSTATTIFGRQYRMPIGLSPVGAASLLWDAADVHMARAARDMGVPLVLSTHAFVPIARVARESGVAPWFQLYLSNDRATSEKALQAAAAAGSDILVLTTDVPVGGNREYNERNGFAVPFRPGCRHLLDGLLHPRWAARVLTGLLRNGGIPAHFVAWGARRDTATWAELAWLRKAWPGKLVIKGILNVADALVAIDHGADGIFVSNHGGRQLDGAPATIRVLGDIAEAVAGRTAVFVDGGIRRGSDVAKALAAGADMAFVGRPACYGLAAAGEAGVAAVLQILGAELDRVMALLGCCSVSQLGPRSIERMPAMGEMQGRNLRRAGVLAAANLRRTRAARMEMAAGRRI